ncbi:MFS transporter [Aeromicrobium piscarium]|uniref:MFS transporter n=1 Tax=Aeromicrobium piscarium TaxID=2590901 RepID=UPI001C8F359E|nr:MFS transporter [Aeromicrobium piscarium]
MESRRAVPLVEPALFRVVSFTAAILGAIIVFVAFSTTLLLTTTLLQQEGWSPLAAGAATLPMAAAATACAPLSGHLVSRVGARPLLLIAGGCLIVGGALLTSLVADTRLPLLFAAYVAIGAGIGFANAPITNTAIDGLPPDRAGVASAMASTARQVATAVGIALAGSLIASARDSGGLAGSLLPGWVWVAACGVGVLLCALAAPSERAPRPGPSGRSGAG